MVLSNENNPAALEGGVNIGSRKFGRDVSHTRRALGVVNQNVVGAQPYPCVANKRALSENQAVCEKRIQIDPVHRPITRKYAAQMGRTKPTCPQVQVRNPNPAPETNGFGECIFIDLEEEKEASENPVPMALEQSEARPGEEDQMEEVEMEDISDEEEQGPTMDIDSGDAKNPLAVVDYVADMYAYYKKVECCSCVSPDYMGQQPDINEKMRSILIDWLIEVHDKFDLLSETLFLTVNLIDRFLSKQWVARKKLQLVGLVAMLLACKYEEVSVPVVGDMILISDKAYTRTEVLEMERLMLNTLQFNMSYPTPYVFMQRFLKAAQSDKKLEQLSYFLIELSLVEYAMLKYPPSLLAAAAIYTAQCTLYGFKQWSKTCEWHSSYSEDKLLECSRLMVGFHKEAGTGRLTGVHRKYCTSKFGYTAKFEAASFLLEKNLA